MSRFYIIPKDTIEYATRSAFPATPQVADRYKTFLDLQNMVLYNWSSNAYHETDFRYEGAPVYHGTYLKPAYLEFDIYSEKTLNFSAGDYVRYTRMGGVEKYKLFQVPLPERVAGHLTTGESYHYAGVQFFADSKYLEVVPFRDMIEGQQYHFSSTDGVETTENVAGIASRIQANLNAFGEGVWRVVVNEHIPSSYNVTEARSISVSGNCLDALSVIYDTWGGLGWMYYMDGDGKNVIEIGLPNARLYDEPLDDNITAMFEYKGGLTGLKQNILNADEFATRLFVFGSDRNMPGRYYNERNIYNASSVNIPNLMLPIADWGETSGLPDASKAYIDNTAAESIYGIVPRIVRFDGSGDYPEIFPSIEEATIGALRAAKQEIGDTEFVPSTAIYTNPNLRIDQIAEVLDAPTDDGKTSGTTGSKYVEELTSLVSHEDEYISASQAGTYTSEVTLCAPVTHYAGRADVNFANVIVTMTDIAPVGGQQPSSVKGKFVVSNSDESIKTEVEATIKESTIEDPVSHRVHRVWGFSVKRSAYPTTIIGVGTQANKVVGTINVKFIAEVTYTSMTTAGGETKTTFGGYVFTGVDRMLDESFVIRLNQIGFDILRRAVQIGGTPIISMKDGMCQGREFEVRGTQYDVETDSWIVSCKRAKDASIGTLYPNTSYPIAAGDHFVILGIEMPDEYVGISSQRMADKAEELLARLSVPQYNYEPLIDAKWLDAQYNSASASDKHYYILREGKTMPLYDMQLISGSHIGYILIDSLTIYENESNIPTYKVTLSDTKFVSKTTKQSVSIMRISSDVYQLSRAQAVQSRGEDGTADVDEADRTRWNAKYDKPSDGIPASDMTQAVRDSLSLADNAQPKIGTKGTHVLPIYFENNAPKTIDGLTVSGDIQSTSGGVSAKGIADLSMSGGGGGGTEYIPGNGITIDGNNLRVKLASTNPGLTFDASGGLMATGGGTSDYNDLENKPSINNVTLSGDKTASQLGLASTSDIANFVTKSVNDLVNYYTKSQTYTQTEVNNLIGAIQQFHYEIVATLPATGQSNVLYLKGPIGQGSDKYEEYVYANNTWVKIGDTSIDLSGYVTTTALNTALANYTTTTELTTLLSGKVDKVSGKGLSTNDYTTAEKQKLASLENYDDSALSNRVSIIEGKESGWDAKYNKPSTGIPKTDLASAVQTSLGKADTALQPTALNAYRTSSEQDAIDNTKADKVSGATNGHLAGLDGNGNLTDSGKKASDFATAAQGAKADSALQGVKVDGVELTKDTDKKVTIPIATEDQTGLVSTEDQTFGGDKTFEGNIHGLQGVSAKGIGDLSMSAGGGGVGTYAELPDKPQIAGVTLVGNKSLSELGIQPKIDGSNKLPYSYLSDTPTIPTSTQMATWDAKYDKPSAGIPKTDLASAVQTSLGKADSALQTSALTPYRTASEQDTIDGGKVDKVTGKGLSTNDYTDAEKTKLEGLENYDDSELNFRVSAIEGKIPSQASSSNQLADKNFVNSTVGTNTANYISDGGQPFTSVSDLPTSGVTNNDYAFVTGMDTEGNVYYDRYKATVSGSSVSWAKEYRLNNSSFTAEQWAAISSGLTSSDKTKLNGIAAGAEVNVQSNWTESDTSSDAYIKNKPTLGSLASKNSVGTSDIADDAITAAKVKDGVMLPVSVSGNAGTATKLASSRTIWGRSFDGSGNVDGDFTSNGNIILNNTKSINFKNPSDSNRNVLTLNGSGQVALAYGAVLNDHTQTLLYGNGFAFKKGDNSTELLGTISPNSDLSMNGGVSAKGIVDLANSTPAARGAVWEELQGSVGSNAKAAINAGLSSNGSYSGLQWYKYGRVVMMSGYYSLPSSSSSSRSYTTAIVPVAYRPVSGPDVTFQTIIISGSNIYIANITILSDGRIGYAFYNTSGTQVSASGIAYFGGVTYYSKE